MNPCDLYDADQLWAHMKRMAAEAAGRRERPECHDEPDEMENEKPYENRD